MKNFYIFLDIDGVMYDWDYIIAEIDAGRMKKGEFIRKFKPESVESLNLLIEEFEKYYGMFLENENLSSIKEEYNSRLVNMNNEVEIIRQDGNYRAQSLGMDEDGGLIVRRQDGSLETVVSGEVSVRGVYGYV